MFLSLCPSPAPLHRIHIQQTLSSHYYYFKEGIFLIPFFSPFAHSFRVYYKLNWIWVLNRTGKENAKTLKQKNFFRHSVYSSNSKTFLPFPSTPSIHPFSLTLPLPSSPSFLIKEFKGDVMMMMKEEKYKNIFIWRMHILSSLNWLTLAFILQFNAVMMVRRWRRS